MYVSLPTDRVDQANPLFHALMQSSLGTALVSLEGSWIAANQALCATLGVVESDLVGRSVLDLISAGDVEASRRALGDLLAGGSSSMCADWQLVHRSGQVLWLRLHSTLVRDDAGHPLCILTQTEDRSGEHDRAVLLRRAEIRFHAAFDSSKEGLAILGMDRRYLAANGAYCCIFGYDESEVVGALAHRIVQPEDREPVAGATQPGATATMTCQEEMRCRHKDGPIICVRLSETVMLDDAGLPLYLVAHAQDITEQYRVAEAQRATDARLRAVISNAPVTIFSIDRQGLYTFSEGSVPPLLGVPHADRVGQSIFALFADLPDIVAAARRALAGEALTHVVQTDDGWFETQWSPIRDAVGAPAGAIGVVIDITARKRAEQALADREALFRALAENSGDLVCIVNAHGEVTYESPSYKRVLGRSLADTRAAGIMDTEFPDDMQVLEASLRRLVVDGAPFVQFESRIIDAFGIWHTLETVAVNRLADPVVAGIISTSRDISQRIAAEDALRRSEMNLRVLVSNTPTLLFTLDAAGSFVVCEGKGLAAFGRTPQDLIGTSSFAIFGHNPAMPVAIRAALAGEDSSLTVAAHDRHFEVRLVPLRDNHGCVVGATGVALDVSDQIRAQQALSERDAQFRRIVETAGEGIWLLNAQAVTTFVNRRMAEMLGYNVEEMLGRPVFDFMDDAAKTRTALSMQLRKQGIAQKLDGKLLAKDGKEVWTTITATTIFDDAGHYEGALAMISDISARRKMERALEHSNRELARSNADLEQFTSVASHDLRSPLNTIGGYAELLSLHYAASLDSDANEFLALIVEAVKHMQALIDDLLAFARMGAKPAPPEPVDCAALVERVKQQLQAAIGESGAEVTCGDLPTLCGQATQIGQLFQNLIGNAIKFHGKDAPRVAISAIPQDQSWLFTVEDNGIGIDPAFAERIFVIFRRLHAREEYPGTGIGLAICKKIVEQHGGRIWVESQPGLGTRVHFTLPAAPAC